MTLLNIFKLNNECLGWSRKSDTNTGHFEMYAQYDEMYVLYYTYFPKCKKYRLVICKYLKNNNNQETTPVIPSVSISVLIVAILA